MWCAGGDYSCGTVCQRGDRAVRFGQCGFRSDELLSLGAGQDFGDGGHSVCRPTSGGWIELAGYVGGLDCDDKGVLDCPGFQTKAQAGMNMKRLTAKVTDTGN